MDWYGGELDADTAAARNGCVEELGVFVAGSDGVGGERAIHTLVAVPVACHIRLSA